MHHDSPRERFELWRISNLAAQLPPQFETMNFAGMICVKGQVTGLRTIIGISEQLNFEGTDAVRETDIVIEREKRDPRRIAALTAESGTVDDYAELHGVPLYDHGRFVLDDKTSTMPLADVKRAVRTAARAVRQAQLAEMADEMPILPVLIP